MQGNNRRLHWRALMVIGVAGLALTALFKIALAAGANTAPAPQQDVLRLETRINQLEQRLISIDTSIRTLEQQSRLGERSAASQEAVREHADPQGQGTVEAPDRWNRVT